MILTITPSDMINRQIRRYTRGLITEWELRHEIYLATIRGDLAPTANPDVIVHVGRVAYSK